MEDSSAASEIVQLSTYIKDHTGFSGSIKTFPSDFVVTEINIHGQLVNEIVVSSFQKASGILSEERTSGPQSSKKLRIDKECQTKESCKIQVGNVHCTTDQHSLCIQEIEDCKDNHVFECYHDKSVILDTLLDDPVREQLHQFAGHLKHTWNSAYESRDVLSEFSLGSISDKNVRASLHGAIRQEYPFLITVTKCDEIIVKANQDYQELCGLVSEEEASGFLKFLDAKLENSKFAFRPDGSKENRKMLHHFLNKKFGKLIESKSFPDSQQKLVIVVRFREKSGFRKRANSNNVEKHIYTAFTLRKENLETLEAINYLSAKLGVLPSDFSYTGIKDKRAITYQAVVVKKVTPQSLKVLGNAAEKKGLRVSHIYSVSEPLRLGQLQGNQFDIIVRDLKLRNNESTSSLKEQICEAIENVKKNGFINYYGSQRFGQGQNIQTDQIGLALLNEEMVKSVKLFFTPEDSDDPVNKAKKYFLQTEDAKGTLAMLPDFKVREKILLRALNRYGLNPDGCRRGWLSIPHAMRIFYVHAYCSKVWNEAASYRVKTYGIRVVTGDLVFSGKSTENCLLNDKVHVVTTAEEMDNKYTMNQVILPMVGYGIQYPTNEVGKWYHKRLADDGLQMCQFRLPGLQLNVPGCYRHLLKYPHDLSYHFLDGTEKETGEESGSLPSLSIAFRLDPSCYATACLGEIMKCKL